MSNWEDQIAELAELECKLLDGCYDLHAMADDPDIIKYAQLDYLVKTAEQAQQLKKEMNNG